MEGLLLKLNPALLLYMLDPLMLHVSFQSLIVVEWTTALGNVKVALRRLLYSISNFDLILIKNLAYNDG